MGSFKWNFQFPGKKVAWARSGEYRACSTVGIRFVDVNWWILWDQFGTHFMLTFVLKICFTLSSSTLKSSAIILIPKLWSVCMRVLTFSTFSSAFIVSGWPVRSSYPLFFLKTYCAILTHRALHNVFLHTPHVKKKIERFSGSFLQFHKKKIDFNSLFNFFITHGRRKLRNCL